MDIVENTAERLVLRNGAHVARPLILWICLPIFAVSFPIAMHVFEDLIIYEKGAGMCLAISTGLIIMAILKEERTLSFDRKTGNVSVLTRTPYLRRHSETVRPLSDIAGHGSERRARKRRGAASDATAPAPEQDYAKVAVTLRWKDGGEDRVTDYLDRASFEGIAAKIDGWLDQPA